MSIRPRESLAASNPVSDGDTPVIDTTRDDRGSTGAAAGGGDMRFAGSAIEAHALIRWTRAVVPVIYSPNDPRTISGWSTWICASPGAIRNWCMTAGIAPRRSLVFARLLRAVIRSEGGRYRLENLLDVVDRRTLTRLLKFAGFDAQQPFPADIDEFLERQTLVRDSDALREIKRALRNDRRRLP